MYLRILQNLNLRNFHKKHNKPLHPSLNMQQQYINDVTSQHRINTEDLYFLIIAVGLNTLTMSKPNLDFD